MLCPTELGVQALGAYDTSVKAAQSSGGRDELEQAQTNWAGLHGVEAADALILGELHDHPQTILELTREQKS